MGDTTVIKVDSSHSPKGLDGQVYLATGKHIAMRMWQAVAPGGNCSPPFVQSFLDTVTAGSIHDGAWTEQPLSPFPAMT